MRLQSHLFYQESIIGTPVKDILLLKEGEEKDKLELSKDVVTTSTDSEVKNHELLNKNENIKQEISTIDEEKDVSINHETNDQENKNQELLKEINCKDTNTITEIENKHQNNILKEIKNKLEDSLKAHEEQDLESLHKIITNDLGSTNNKKTNDNIELTKENNKDILDSSKKDECNVIEPFQENQNDLIVSKLIENKDINLNISDEIKVLNDTAINSIVLNNTSCDNYLQVNGEVSSINCQNPEHNFDGTIENHIESNIEDVEPNIIEIQNSLNTFLNKDLKVEFVEKENNDKIPLIIDSEYNENVKERINENVANQDSLSNSSDSETIINSESLQIEINGDNAENNEQTAVAKPISMITIQTCDTVDSDCSEAYLTPNELNDTPKKVLEKPILNANDHISIDNDNVMYESNPSIESINEIDSPSKNKSEEIVEQNASDKNFNKVEQNIDIVDENIDKIEEIVNKVDENDKKLHRNINKTEETVDNIKNNTDNKETIAVNENCNETEVKSKEDVNIVLKPHEEHNLNNKEGMFYPLINIKKNNFSVVERNE